MTSIVSTDTPTHRLSGNTSVGASFRNRAARFVNNWYVCCGVSAITWNTCRMKQAVD